MSVQTFSTAEARHNFVIDEKPYFLPGLSVDDFDQLEPVLSGAPENRFSLTREFVFAHTDARTVKALRTLSIGQFTQLFRSWCGLDGSVTPGESESSAE